MRRYSPVSQKVPSAKGRMRRKYSPSCRSPMPPHGVAGGRSLAALPGVAALAVFRAGGLVPPHVVELHPAAQVHGEVLVGRLEPEEQAVLEAGRDAQVAADHVALLVGARLLLLRFGLLLHGDFREPPVHGGVDGGLADLALKNRGRAAGRRRRGVLRAPRGLSPGWAPCGKGGQLCKRRASRDRRSCGPQRPRGHRVDSMVSQFHCLTSLSCGSPCRFA